MKFFSVSVLDKKTHKCLNNSYFINLGINVLAGVSHFRSNLAIVPLVDLS